MYGLDHSATETPAIFVRNRVLTGRHSPLWLIEQNSRGAIALGLEGRCLVYLPITYFYRTPERHRSRINQPVQGTRGQ
jgi:hypothetical protein